MMHAIVDKFNVVLLFLLPIIGDQNYYQKMQKKIKDYKLKEKFIFVTQPLKNTQSLWKISDLVIRATNTDGSSFSILEALSCGVPVIASDCVERPKDSILFKTRDVNNLILKTKEILSNISYYKNKLKNHTSMNDVKLLINLYDDIIKNNE